MWRRTTALRSPRSDGLTFCVMQGNGSVKEENKIDLGRGSNFPEMNHSFIKVMDLRNATAS